MEIDHENEAASPGGAGTEPTTALGRVGTRFADRARRAGGGLSEVLRRNGVTAVGGELSTPAGLSVRRGTFGQGESAALPTAEEELWVVLRGHLRVRTVGGTVTARAGDSVHVPENSPGRLEAVEDTAFVRVSVSV